MSHASFSMKTEVSRCLREGWATKLQEPDISEIPMWELSPWDVFSTEALYVSTRRICMRENPISVFSSSGDRVFAEGSIFAILDHAYFHVVPSINVNMLRVYASTILCPDGEIRFSCMPLTEAAVKMPMTSREYSKYIKKWIEESYKRIS